MQSDLPSGKSLDTHAIAKQNLTVDLGSPDMHKGNVDPYSLKSVFIRNMDGNQK